MHPGQPVTIAIDMFPDTAVHGVVNSIAPASGEEFALLPPDNATGNFTKIVQRIPVKITIDPHDPAGWTSAPRHVGRADDRYPPNRNMADIGAVTEQPVPLKTWIAVGGSIIGAFMAVLNIQITNASLPYIEGGIGTGGVNGAWVITAYLIGEIIVIPMTDFLSRVFSLRRYLITNTVLFLIFSVACGQAHTLPEMIVLRGLQGFSGGVLIPLSFTIIVAMLPPSKRPMGLAGFAVTATFAPAIGPTIGGWLTDNYGWPTIFYINLAPGLLMLAALIYSLPRAPMQLGLLRRGDWLGIALMAIGLAALQTILDDGNTYDWFGSPFIVKLSVIAAVTLTAFIVVELVRPEPLVNLRLLTRRNFGFGTLGNFLLGFALYGSAYLLPQYLANAQGFNSQQIGEVMAWTGLPQLVLIPFVPLLMRRIDARLLVIVGLTVFAVSCFMNLNLDANYAAPQLLIPNITRAFGQALVMTPLVRHRHGRHHRGRGGQRIRPVQHAPQPRRSNRNCRAGNLLHQARAVPLLHHQRACLPAAASHTHASERIAAAFLGEWHDRSHRSDAQGFYRARSADSGSGHLHGLR